MGNFTYYTIYSPAICAKYRKNRLEMRLQICYSILRKHWINHAEHYFSNDLYYFLLEISISQCFLKNGELLCPEKLVMPFFAKKER